MDGCSWIPDPDGMAMSAGNGIVDKAHLCCLLSLFLSQWFGIEAMAHWSNLSNGGEASAGGMVRSFGRRMTGLICN